MPSALLQQIMDREDCGEQEAEFIVAIEPRSIDGYEFSTEERPA